MKKEEHDKKKDLLLYLDGAIAHLEPQIKKVREQLKNLLREKQMIQDIRKAIK